MSASQSPLAPHPSVEEGIHALVDDGKNYLRSRYERCQECVMEHPTSSILAAVAAGCILDRLPLRAIFVTKMRILAAVAPPVLFAVGAAKMCEYLQNKAREKVASAP